MKKMMMILAAAVCGVAQAATTNEVEGANILGVIELDSRAPWLCVGIPFHRASLDGKLVTVADVVQTSTLGEGDMLYAFDHCSGLYDMYEITNGVDGVKGWKPQTTVTVTEYQTFISEADDPRGVELTPGYGLWLHRVGESTNGIVRIVGQVAPTYTNTVIVGNKSLLGVSVYGDGLDVRTDARFLAPNCVNGDQIQVPQTNGTLAIWKFDGKTKAWNSVMRGSKITTLAPGTAFWFKRSADAEENFEVVW